MRRMLTVVAAVIVILFGFTGCEQLLELLGIGIEEEVDLTVEIVITNANSVRVSVTNGGSEAVTNFEFRLYLTTRTDVQPADQVVYTDFIDIPPQTTEPVDVPFASFIVPGTFPSGDYRIGVIVDPDNNIPESNDSNNKATTFDTYAYTGGDVNQAPTANAGPDQTGITVGSTVFLSGSGSDPDGDTLSYSWTGLNPSGVNISGSITNPGAANASVVVSSTGTYTFMLTVSDGKGGTDTDTVLVTVSAQLSDDGYENNDTMLTATDLGPFYLDEYFWLDDSYGLTMLASDAYDYYEITVAEAGYLYIDTYFDGANTDLDLYLYDSTGTLLESSAEYNDATIDYEIISYFYVAAGTYYIGIEYWDGSDTLYDLYVELSSTAG